MRLVHRAAVAAGALGLAFAGAGVMAPTATADEAACVQSLEEFGYEVGEGHRAACAEGEAGNHDACVAGLLAEGVEGPFAYLACLRAAG